MMRLSLAILRAKHPRWSNVHDMKMFFHYPLSRGAAGGEATEPEGGTPLFLHCIQIQDQIQDRMQVYGCLPRPLLPHKGVAEMGPSEEAEAEKGRA